MSMTGSMLEIVPDQLSCYCTAYRSVGRPNHAIPAVNMVYRYAAIGSSIDGLVGWWKLDETEGRDSARWLGMWPCHRSERFFWAPGSAGARAGACGAQNVKTVHPPDRRAMS